jgi:hypothetical protein
MPRLKVAMMLSLATTLWAPAFGQAANPARPGTLNYVEGQASIDGRAVSAHSVGKAELDQGQTLATSNGKVELLLTPGVFLRLGEDSTVKMVSPDLLHTEVALERGRAEIEVDELHNQNRLLIDFADGGQTHVLKSGLYGFNAGSDTMKVFDGKAEVFPTSSADKGIGVKGGRQIAVTADATKPVKFDKDQAEEGALYQWSSLRSEYLGEANERLAERYEGGAGFAPGWAWDPGLYSYTWLPGEGAFLNPFGFGFYSPAYLYGGGLGLEDSAAVMAAASMAAGMEDTAAGMGESVAASALRAGCMAGLAGASTAAALPGASMAGASAAEFMAGASEVVAVRMAAAGGTGRRSSRLAQFVVTPTSEVLRWAFLFAAGNYVGRERSRFARYPTLSALPRGWGTRCWWQGCELATTESGDARVRLARSSVGSSRWLAINPHLRSRCGYPSLRPSQTWATRPGLEFVFPVSSG